jgi:general secretion pathway protein G
LTESKAKAAKIQIESFASALDLYFLDTGRYPAGNEGLAALVRRPGNIASWNGPYLKGGVVPPDPWGNPYVYRAPGQHGTYDILSYGADGTEGGTGAGQDITSWQR